jgi:tartrate-resistant acid phosphatase type 5
VSGAGGKLRTEPPTGFEQARTKAWAAAGHFLLGRADPERLVLEPRADGPIEIVDRDGRPLEPRLEIRL